MTNLKYTTHKVWKELYQPFSVDKKQGVACSGAKVKYKAWSHTACLCALFEDFEVTQNKV